MGTVFSFVNNVFENALIYFSSARLVFGSQPEQGYFAERLYFLAITFFNLFLKVIFNYYVKVFSYKDTRLTTGFLISFF